MSADIPDRCPFCHVTLPEGASNGDCPSCGPTQHNTNPQPIDTIDLAGSPSALGKVSTRVDLPDGHDLDRTTVAEPDTFAEETQAPSPHPDRIHLLGEIARGGMGAVLKGRDENLRREIAIKILLDQHRDNPVMLRRFIEEAQICGQLQHPGIVPVYESGILADRRPYFAMKLVKGQTLAAFLSERSSPTADLPRFLNIFEQVCQAVAYAHARGVIHRDLKPANIMVGGFGEVQVMDWGLAKVLQQHESHHGDPSVTDPPTPDETIVSTARSDATDSNYSQAGSILGTPSYMAPEQARGEYETIDERADVFALGSILCMILTGQPAFTGESSGAIHRKAARGDTADALARLDGCEAGPALTALAKHCLATEPSGRPRDAGAVSERVTAYLAGVQEQLRNAEVERARAEVRANAERTRRRLQMGLAVAVLAITTLGGLGFTYELYRRQNQAARLNLALNEATLVRDQALAAIDDPARWRAATEAIRGVDLVLGDTDAPAARTRLKALRGEVEAGLAAARRGEALLQALLDARANAQDAGTAGTDAAYTAAFAAAGIDLERSRIDENAKTLRASRPERIVEIASYLDHWADVRRQAGGARADWLQPLELARAIDEDADRGRLRALIITGDRHTLVPALKALAASAETADWPASSVLLLTAALSPFEGTAAAVPLLEQAVARHPGDVWINFNLATLLNTLQPPRREEALRYYTAARALRPETAHDLAHLLEKLGRADEAEAVFRDLTQRRPENARHLVCFGRHLKQDESRSREAAEVLDRAIQIGRETVRKAPNDANAHFNLGLALVNSGDWPGVIAAYREAIRLDPNKAKLHFSLGLALGETGDLPGAIAAFREAIRLKPDDAEAHASLGDNLGNSGDLPGAIAAYREAIRLKPDHVQAHHNLGVALANSGDLPGAIAAYREAIRLNPGDAEVHYNLGIALANSSDLPGAIAAYREAIRLSPDHAQAHTNLGALLSNSGDYLGAIPSLREAIRLNPDDAIARINLAITLAKSGDQLGAIVAYREAIRLKPEYVDVHNNLGDLLASSGDLPGAIAAFREAIRLKPDHAGAHNNLGLALVKSGDVTGAIAAYREAIRLKPDDARIHFNLGIALFKSGDVTGAIVAYREAIRLKPEYVDVHNNLGDLLASSGDLPGAIAAFREAIRLKPDHAGAHNNLGAALARSGDRPGAVAAFRESVRLNPDQAEAHCNLGQILRAQGHYAEALAEFRAGHELGSKRPDWRLPSAQWITETERLVQLAERLPAVLRGEAQPADNAERINLAQMAYQTRHYAASVRLRAEALEAEPKLADDRRNPFRYYAACCAILAATGKGEDDPPPDDAAKAEFRRQALDWLKAELAAWSPVLESEDPQARAAIAPALQDWQTNPDLASVRDEKALEAFSEAERNEWQALWREAAALREKAGSKP